MKKKALRVFSILFPIVLIMMACGCPSGQSNKKTELTPEEIEENIKMSLWTRLDAISRTNPGFWKTRDFIWSETVFSIP